MGTLEIHPATGERWPDLERFFAAHRAPNGCWCMWPRLERGRYQHGDPANRTAIKELVLSGSEPGLIAYLDGRPVGWCAVGRRCQYPQYLEQVPTPAAEWAIACIFVEPDCRGEGVAGELIEAAVRYAEAKGATAVDGPPPWWKAEARAPLSLFLARGFEKIGEGARMPLLRRTITHGQ